MPTNSDAAESRGTWIVCVRDVSAGEDEYLGPFRSEEKAQAVARRLRRDIEAVGVSTTDSLDAIVEWVRPGTEAVDYREEMLADLATHGYTKDAARA